MIAENSAKAAASLGGEGRHMTKSLYEITHPEQMEKTETGQEIVKNIMNRMGLGVREDGIV